MNGKTIAMVALAAMVVGGIAWYATRPAGPMPMQGDGAPVPPSQRDGTTDVQAGLRLVGQLVEAGTSIYGTVRADAREQAARDHVSSPPDEPKYKDGK